MYSRKKFLEPIEEVATAIWACTKEGCVGWMRDNFSFETLPTCRLCSSAMSKAERMLPTVNNSNEDMKLIKKGITI